MRSADTSRTVASERYASLPCRVPAGLTALLRSLDLDDLMEPHVLWPWLGIESYFAVWEAMEARLDDETHAVAMGRGAANHGLLEPVFLVCLSARHLGEALAHLARYKSVLCPERLVVGRESGALEIAYDWPTAQRPPPHNLVEAELSFLLSLARRATGLALDDARVTLTRSEGDPHAWAEAFGAPVAMGSRRATLRLDARVEEVRFETHNSVLFSALQPALEAERSRRPTTAAARVRHVIQTRVSAGELTVQAVARELGMSARTMQRRLRNAGTSFGDLVAEARCDRATYLLRESDLSLAEISYLVGYESPPSFFRAFYRWTGKTPTDYRRDAIG